MRLLIAAFCLMLWSGLAPAQNIESIIMPGQLIAGHAKRNNFV